MTGNREGEKKGMKFHHVVGAVVLILVVIWASNNIAFLKQIVG